MLLTSLQKLCQVNNAENTRGYRRKFWLRVSLSDLTVFSNTSCILFRHILKKSFFVQWRGFVA